MHAQYTAIDGFDLSTVTSAVLASLADTTAETIGVDETTEHVTNGIFDSNITGWTDVSTGDGAISWNAGGYLQLDSTTGTSRARQSITTIAGQTYSISGDASAAAQTYTVYVGSTAGASDLLQMSSGVGAFDGTFKATGATTYLEFVNTGAVNKSLDDVTVKATGNVVANYNFQDSANSQWTLGDGWSIGSGVASCDGTQTAASNLSQTYTFTLGLSYVFTYTVSNYSAGNVRFAGGGAFLTNRSANGTYTETFECSSVGSGFSLSADADFVGDIDNVSLRLAVPDLSSNADGLEVHGQLTKSAVNTGSGLMGFSGFTSINRLKQVNTGANINVGAGDFTLIIWVKAETTLASTQGIFSWQEYDDATNRIQIQFNSAGVVGVYLTSISSAAATTDLRDGLYKQLCVTRVSGTVYVYINAAETDSFASSADIEGATSPELVLGGLNLAGAYGLTDGSIALPQFYNSGITAQQIRTIYDNEKVLFNQYEPYSQVDQAVNYEIGLSNSNPGIESKEAINTALSGKQTGLSWYNKNAFNCQSVLVQGLAERGKAKKFLRSTKINSFTFDEVGTEAAPDNPITVYRTSGGRINRVPPDFFSLDFSLREA